MRRPERLGLAALILMLTLVGAYSAYWWIAARRLESGLGEWAQAMRARQIEASWKTLEVSGYPLGFTVEIADAAWRDDALTPAPRIRAPVLVGAARPWDFANWRLAAPQGVSADLAASGGRPGVAVAAMTGDGAVSIGRDGGATIWVTLREIGAEAGKTVRVDLADAWIALPQAPPASHAEPAIGVAVVLRQVRLPAATHALGGAIDELALGLTFKGVLPNGPLPQALAAWRDSGGTIELDNLRLDWGGLGATATGALSLDRDLQPIGGFTGAIEGYDQVLSALVQSGRMRASDAGLARLALTMLAKAGPDGRPQITTSLTMQNGQMFLGPARLGPAPRIAWQ
jgi:hypothetical protein